MRQTIIFLVLIFTVALGTLTQADKIPLVTNSIEMLEESSAWAFRTRASIFSPQIEKPRIREQAGGYYSAAGLMDPSLKVDRDVTPEFALNYFFTRSFAAELSMQVTELDMHATFASGSVDQDLGNVHLLTSVLSLLYFVNVHPDFKPYFGAGVALFHVYRKSPGAFMNADIAGNTGIVDNTFSKSVPNNVLGGVLQLGFDLDLNKNFSLNLDFKQMVATMDADISGNQFTQPAETKILRNPMAIGLGLVYHFS